MTEGDRGAMRGLGASHGRPRDRAFPQVGAALVAGLMFWWPFLRKFEYSALFSLHANPADDMWGAYMPTMLLLFVVLLLGTAFHGRVEKMLCEHRQAACGVAAAASLGWLLVYVAPLAESALPQAQPAIEAAGCVLSALGYAALTLCWGASLAATPVPQAAAGLSISLVLSTLTQLTVFLPGDAVLLAVAIASPAVSAACWLAYKAPDIHAESAARLAGSRHVMPLGALAMLGIFLIAGRVGVGLLSYSTESIPGNDRLLTIGATVLFALCLIVVAARANDWGRLFQLVWSVMAVVFMAAMFALLADNSVVGHVATATLSAVLTCFEMVLFVILAISSRLAGVSGVLAFGLATALFRALPHGMGKILAPLLMSAGAESAARVTSFVIPIMLFMLVVATIVFMNARIMGKVHWLEADEVPAGSARHAQAGDIVARAGLTPREADVLLLMGEGRSYQRIADALGISLGTVQGHVKCIYRKLDVHTKQEVIELVHAEDRPHRMS